MNLKKEQGVIYEKIWREQRENEVIIISKEKTFLKLFIPVNEQNSVKVVSVQYACLSDQKERNRQVETAHSVTVGK